MGNRAIYIIAQNGETNYFYAHMGANALSPLLRLAQAKELQAALPEPQTIAHIFAHLDYGGQYQPQRLDDADMFCERIDPIAIRGYQKSYAEHGELEMRITLDLDHNDCLMEYNPNCAWYRTMGNLSIPLDVGLENVEKLLAHAEETGIDDFGKLLTVYNHSTGIAELMESSRGYMRFEEHLNSPQAQEDRERYWRMFGKPAEQDEETAEDGEESEER